MPLYLLLQHSLYHHLHLTFPSSFFNDSLLLLHSFSFSCFGCIKISSLYLAFLHFSFITKFFFIIFSFSSLGIHSLFHHIFLAPYFFYIFLSLSSIVIFCHAIYFFISSFFQFIQGNFCDSLLMWKAIHR